MFSSSNETTEKSARRAIGLVAIVIVATLLFGLRQFLLNGNLHPVIDGAVYRSAQPTPERIRSWTQEFGLRSLINLKGVEAGDLDDDAAAKAAHHAKLDTRYVRLSGRRWPSPAEVERLIANLDEVERPLLLHCLSGTDRSGLAAAIALLLDGSSLDEAGEQFALSYGYPGKLLGSDLPGFLERYRDWLERHRTKHSVARFRTWVAEDYIAYYYRVDLAFEPLPQKPSAGQPFDLIVHVANRSPEPIPMHCTEGQGVRLSLRLRQLEGDGRDLQERRFCQVAQPLSPGATVRITARNMRLTQPGRYEVTADLVDEYREHWFEDMGSPVERLTLEIAPTLASP